MTGDKTSKEAGLIASRMFSAEPEASDPMNYLAGLLAQNPYIYKNQWFFKQDVTLDGYAFENCKFEECRLVVEKGNFRLLNCALSGCIIFYSGDAQRTIQIFQSNIPPAMRSGGPALLPAVDAHGRITIG